MRDPSSSGSSLRPWRIFSLPYLCADSVRLRCALSVLLVAFLGQTDGGAAGELFYLFRDLLTGRLLRPVSEWSTVEFDDEVVRLHVEPPGRRPWSQQFRWSDVERVCFKAEDYAVSDGIYVFSRTRPESYVVPTEATGGAGFWSEIIRRGLFDPRLAMRAASALEGVFCWPPVPPR